VDRLPSRLLVGALLRRTGEAGGFGAVLARGDEGSGAILVVAVEGARTRLLERGFDEAGRPAVADATPPDATPAELDEYWRRRRTRDPDLWVVELDVAGVERLVAETLTPN